MENGKKQAVFGNIHHGPAVGLKGNAPGGGLGQDGGGHHLLSVVDKHLHAETVKNNTIIEQDF